MTSGYVVRSQLGFQDRKTRLRNDVIALFDNRRREQAWVRSAGSMAAADPRGPHRGRRYGLTAKIQMDIQVRRGKPRRCE
jgi:hypothetical protein